MRKKHIFFKRVLVLLLCLCIFAGSTKSFSRAAQDEDITQEEDAASKDSTPTEDGTDNPDRENDTAAGTGAGNASADEEGDTLTKPAGTGGEMLPGEAASEEGDATDSSASVAGNEGVQEEGAGAGAGTGAGTESGEEDGNKADDNKDGDQSEDDDDELTPEEEEELRRWLEENGGIMTLGAGDPTTINGAIMWKGDADWKTQTRPAYADIEKCIKLYKVEAGVETPVAANVSCFEIDDGAGVGYNINTDEPDVGVEYVVRLEGMVSYTPAYPTITTGAKVSLVTGGATTGMAAEDFEANLDFEDFTIKSLYYGTGTKSFEYVVKAGKATGTEQDFKGEYTIDGGASLTSNNGKISIQNVSNTGKAAVIRLPKGLKCTVESTATDYITVKTEDKAGDKLTGYSFSHINSNYTAKARKIWNDNNRPAGSRPPITLKLCYQIAGSTTDPVELTEANKTDVGFPTDKAVPTLQVKDVDHNTIEYSYAGLPESVVVEEGGVPTVKNITWTITEETLDDYEPSYTTDGDTTVIRNTLKTDFSATIEWKDGQDDYKYRPDNVGLRLYRYAKQAGTIEEVTVPITVTPNETNPKTWSVSIEDLPRYDETGYPYTYYLEENPPVIQPGFDTDPDINDVPDTRYGTPAYTNTGDHAMVTDKCFNGGTITNTKTANVDFSVRYVWRDQAVSTTPVRPDTSIYLYRFVKEPGQPLKPESAAVVTVIDTSGNSKIEQASADKDLAAGTEKTVAFNNLPKYDSEGKQLVYIAKAVSDGNTYTYFYPDDYPYGAPNGELINLVPQVIEQHTFTITWNSAAYPTVPESWTENVILQSKTGSTDWKTVSGTQYDKYKEPAFTNFSAAEPTKEMVMFLPKYGSTGEELEYRIVPKNLVKDGGTTAEIGTDNIFTIDGRQYKSQETVNGIVNTLYNKMQYKVIKEWKDELKKTPVSADLFCTVQLTDDTDTVVKDVNGEECNQKLTTDNQNGNTLTYTFEINRYDDDGRERSISVEEIDFAPKKDADSGKPYAKLYYYGRDGSDDSIMTGRIVNYIPSDDPAHYIRLEKIWKDGGDIGERQPIIITLIEKATDQKYNNTDYVLSPQNQWRLDVNIQQHQLSDFTVHEVQIGNDADQTKNAAVTWDTNTGKGSAIYNGTDFEVTEKAGTNYYTVTNKRVGEVTVEARIEWSDTSTPDARPNITATLQKRDEHGNWEPYLDNNGAQVTLTLTRDRDGHGNDPNQDVWAKKFQDAVNGGDLKLPKYDDEGNVISYNFQITADYSDLSAEDQNGYTETGEESGFDKNDKNNFVKTYELTRHSSKTLVINKIWKGDVNTYKPDIYWTYQRGIGRRDPRTNEIVLDETTLKDYTALETEFGKIEVRWTRISDYEFTCEISNLERFTEDGDVYLYYVTEHMVNPNGYNAYYFDAAATPANPDANVQSWTLSANQEAAMSGGYIVNRLEGGLKIEGSKQWKNLEPGTSTDKLPEPTIYLKRSYEDPLPGKPKNVTPDTDFNNQQLSFKMTGDKDSYTFPAADYQEGATAMGELPVYNKEGRKYIYTVEEKLDEIPGRVYVTSTTDDFSLVNEYKVDNTNTREITVTKIWNSDISIPGAQYPKVTYTLYRYAATEEQAAALARAGNLTVEELQKIATQNARNNINGTEVGKITLSAGGMVGTEYIVSHTFGNLRIASPQGYDYAYKLVEELIDGYVAGNDATDPKQQMHVVKQTGNTQYNQVVETFINMVGLTSASTVDNTEIKFKNKYVGDVIVNTNDKPNPAVTISGKKIWHDTGYEFLRPDALTLVVKRYADYTPAAGTNTPAEVIPINNGTTVTNGITITWTNVSKQADTTTWNYEIKEEPPASETAKWLLTYAPNGTRYRYEIEEVIPENYKDAKKVSSSVSAPDPTKLVMGDLNNYMKTSLIIQKKWNDNGNRYGLRPKSITVQLQRTTDPHPRESSTWENVSKGTDGTEDGVQIFNSDNNWTYTYNHLPVADEHGNKYYYRAIETQFNEIDIIPAKNPYEASYSYNTDSYASVQNGNITIINTLLPATLEVTKIWVGDQNNKYNTRPKAGTKWSVEVELQKKLDSDPDTKWETFYTTTINGTFVQNQMTFTYPNLPKCDLSGATYVYRAVEKNEPGNYTCEEVYSTKTDTTTLSTTYVTTITNTLKVDANRKDVTVQKSWYPTSESSGTNKVTVELQQKAEGETNWSKVNAAVATQVLSASTTPNWTYTWTEVPEYTATGKKITYQVVEKKIESGSTNITNRYVNAVNSTDDTANHLQKIEIKNTELIDYAFDIYWINNQYGLTSTASFVLYRKVKATTDNGNPQFDRMATSGWTPVTKNAKGEDIKAVTLDGDKLHALWKDLPKYSETGEEYIYQVAETRIGAAGAANGKDLPTSNLADNYKTYTIENTVATTSPASGAAKEIQKASVKNTLVLTEKKVTKKWDFSTLNGNLYDSNNAATTETYRTSLLPADLSFTLKSNTGAGNTYENVAKKPTTSAEGYITEIDASSRTSDWTYTYKNLPKYRLDGTTEIHYQVTEELPAAKNYNLALDKKESHADTTGAEVMTTVTNAVRVINLSGTKIWSDFNNVNGLRPTDLLLEVYANDVRMNPQPAIVWNKNAATNQWTYTVSGLPRYVWSTADSKYIGVTYTVKEIEPAGYWRKNNSETNNTGTNFDNQLCVIKLWHTVKDGTTAADTLKGALFALSGTFQRADKTEEPKTINLTLTDGELLLAPSKLGGFGLIPGKTYTLSQTTAVGDYQMMDGAVTFTIDKNGVITITNAAIMHDNPGGTNSPAAKVIAMTADTPAILQIQNCKTLARVELIKVDKDNATKKLAGVKFKLYRQEDGTPSPTTDAVLRADGTVDTSKSFVFTTNADGKISVVGLTEGKYYFVETQTLDDYELDATPQEFEVGYTEHWTGDANTIRRQMVNKKLHTSLQIQKLDVESGTPIKGVRFKVEFEPASGDPKVEYILETDASGYAKIGTDIPELIKGKYTITEIFTPTGYILEQDGAAFKCEFTVGDAINMEHVYIQEEWLHEEYSPGVTNREAMQFDCPKFETYLHLHNGEKGKGVYNARQLGSVTIHKVDGDDTAKNLNDVGFKLEKKKDDGWLGNIANFLTGKTYEVVDLNRANIKTKQKDGVLKITGLEWGTYRITEVKPNDGYTVFGEDPSFTFRVWGGVDGVVDWVLESDSGSGKIKNYQTNLQIGVEKTYDSSDKMKDVELSLSGLFAGETAVTTKEWTSKDSALEELKGELIIGKTYTLTERERPAGYEEWKQKEVKFHLDATGQIVFESGSPAMLSDSNPAARADNGAVATNHVATLWVHNVEVNAKLRVEKTGAGGKLLKDVTFDLFRSDGTQITGVTIQTNADGYWESNPATLSLPEGEYYLKETWISTFYRPNITEEIPFTVTATDHFETTGKPVTVRVVNVPKLNLVDMNTSRQSLNEYVFEVYGLFNDIVPDGDPTINPLTDKQTMLLSAATLEDFNRLIKPGETYEMTQIAINNGYYLNGSTRFTVEADYSVTMDNNAEYQFEGTTGTLIIINRPIPKPSGGIGGDTPPGGGGKGGPGEDGDEEEGSSEIPTFESETDVPDPGSPDAPPVIKLIRGGNDKLFYKTQLGNGYVYMADDGEVLGHKRMRSPQTSDSAHPEIFILMMVVSFTGIVICLNRRRKYRL